MTTEGNTKSIQARIEALGLNNNDNRKSMAPPTNPVTAPMQPRVVQLTKKSHTAGEITAQSSVNENGSEKHLPLPPPPRGTSRLSVQPANNTAATKPVVHYRTTLPPPPKTPTSQPSSPQPAAESSSPVANASSPQPSSETPEPVSNVRKTMTTPPIPPRRTASDLGQQQPQVVLKKKPVVKPAPPVPRGPKPLMSTEIPKETHQALQQEIEKEEEKKGFIQYVPPAQVAEVKVEEVISASDQLLKEQFAKKYESPTPQEIKAAITLEKYYRSRLARKAVSRRKKNLFHRENCAKEILSTEETYVHNLKVLVEVYLKPLRELAAQSNPIIAKEHVSTIFSDVEVIVGFNSHFLDQLRERISSFNRYTKLGDIILGMAPFFKTYTRYCNNFDRSSEILKECRKNEELRVAIQQMDKDPRTTKLGLSSYLILPIQRVPRYRLLLQDYIKHMEPDHKDYTEVGVALKKICESADHLNATMRSIDATTVIIKIQEMFSPEIKLLEAHRRLLKEGPIADSFGNKMYIHLFNDIFLYSKRKEKNFEKKADTDLTNSVVFDYVGESDTKFKLQSTEGELIMYAATPEEKKEWLAAIHSAIEAKRASKKQTINVDLQAMQDDSSTTFALAMSNDQEDIQIDDETCVRKLKQGDALLKICRASRPHFRKFILSQDETKLMWGSPNKNKTEAVVPLLEVKKILVGQKTALFQKNKNPEYEGLSFSLLYRDRTLDLVCKDKRQFITWVQGLTFLLSRQANGETGTTVSTASSTADNSDAELIADLRKEKKKFKEQFERIGDSYTWGQGAKGALGHGDQNDQFEPLVMKDFLYLDVEAMAAENSAGVALMTTGEVFTWGSGQAGRLGHGDESDRLRPTFIKLLQGKKIAKVTMGNLHTMCIEDTGIVWAFGSNEFGQLGLGSELVGKNQTKPTIVALLKNYKPTDAQCGQWHSAAISESGQLLTWGRGEDGQLGHGDKLNKHVPTVVYVLSEIKTIECALGLWHSMALTADGRVYSWGNATYGQLGHGNTELSLIPKEIAALTGKKIIQIAAGSAHSACITATGEIYSWGNGIYGQIGDGRKEHCYTPTLVHSLRTERCKQISCGINHTLALMHSGKTYSWGAGTYGRLGLKSENDEPIPQQVPLLADKVVRQVYAGGSQSCAVCAHQWVPDKDAVACMQCKTKFTFFNRRHHCRYCGGIFCNSCTSKRIMLLRFGFEGAVRVCDNCYQILSKR